MPFSKIFFGKASPHPSIISESNSIYFCGKEEGEKIETSQLITRIESPGANFTFIRRRGGGGTNFRTILDYNVFTLQFWGPYRALFR